MKTTLIVCTAAASLFAGAAAAEEAPREIVRFNTNELQTVEGREAILERIEEAADDVCEIPRGRYLELRAQQRACIEEARAGAERQLERKLAGLGRTQLARLEISSPGES